MMRRTLQLVASGALLLSGCLSGCLSADETSVEQAVAADDDTQVVAVTQAPIALRAGASVGEDEIDGYSENGIGVYLSADDTAAMLTVYVVTPGEQAVFTRPTLHLTTQHGDIEWTQDREFETVTLKAGQSRTFTQEPDGALLNVDAEVSAKPVQAE